MKEQNARAAPKLRFTKEETEMNPLALDNHSAKTKQAIRRTGKVNRPGKRKASMSRESPKAPLPSAGQADQSCRWEALFFRLLRQESLGQPSGKSPRPPHRFRRKAGPLRRCRRGRHSRRRALSQTRRNTRLVLAAGRHAPVVRRRSRHLQ